MPFLCLRLFTALSLGARHDECAYLRVRLGFLRSGSLLVWWGAGSTGTPYVQRVQIPLLRQWEWGHFPIQKQLGIRRTNHWGIHFQGLHHLRLGPCPSAITGHGLSIRSHRNRAGRRPYYSILRSWVRSVWSRLRARTVLQV